MQPLTTEQKGQIALLKVQLAAARRNATVLVPTIPARYDVVLDYQERLSRAQVKYADSPSPPSEGAVRLDLHRRKRRYTRREIDVLLVYMPQLDQVCWFGPEVFHEKMALQLRLSPAKNGQRKG